MTRLQNCKDYPWSHQWFSFTFIVRINIILLNYTRTHTHTYTCTHQGAYCASPGCDPPSRTFRPRNGTVISVATQATGAASSCSARSIAVWLTGEIAKKSQGYPVCYVNVRHVWRRTLCQAIGTPYSVRLIVNPRNERFVSDRTTSF